MESVIQLLKGGIWGFIFLLHVALFSLTATSVVRLVPSSSPPPVKSGAPADGVTNAEKKITAAYQKDTSSDSFMLHGAAWALLVGITLGVGYLILGWLQIQGGISPYFVKMMFVLPLCGVALVMAGWFIDQIPPPQQPLAPNLNALIDSGSDYLGLFQNIWVVGLFILLPAIYNAISGEQS